MSRPRPPDGPRPPTPADGGPVVSAAPREALRRRPAAVLLALLAILVGGTAVALSLRRAAWNRHVRAELASAREDREAGRLARAARRLSELAGRGGPRADVLEELGSVEFDRGRYADAFAAWDRIPPEDPRAVRAATRRAEHEMIQGRFTAAEARLRRALEAPPSPDRLAAREALVRLLRTEGRFAEARRLYLGGVADAPDLARFLRRLHRIDTEPFATEGMDAYLANAADHAPDDDRVALARAHLAAAQGRLDDARRLLDDLARRHPDDPAIPEVRLAWARAAGRPDVAWTALSQLPADPTTAADLASWFAAARGDAPAERAALERWRRADPAAVRPLVRLAERAAAAGRDAEAATLRASRAELERARSSYQALLARDDIRAAAPDLARLAETLRRPFEAACWRQVAGAAGPRPAPPSPHPGTLADLLINTPQPDINSAPPPPPAAAFADQAEIAGLTFLHDNGDPGRGMTPPVTSCGGVALLDFDADGWLDVYCVQGGPFPPPPAAPAGDRLYRNRTNGTFEDVTQSSGISSLVRGYGHGIAVGDIDNNGTPDLFLTRWRTYQLLLNRGDGTFVDATESAGLAGDRDWPTSAAFADLDNDGDLDLYVCHYLDWDPDRKLPCVDPRDPAIYRCMPRDFPALPDHVFRNDAGRFIDATAEAGLIDRDGRGLGVVAADLDADGLIDLFVANDTTPNYLFRNLGGFRFEEAAELAGVGSNAQGGYQAGMGVACGDLDGDGLPDLFVTNFYDESTTFFRNLGGGHFADQTAAVGLAAPSRYLLGFGIVPLDANADGRLDLLTANGHVHDGRPAYPWKMPAQLLLGTGGGRLVEASTEAGPPFAVPHVGRGLAAGDLDNDGRIDALLAAQNEPLIDLRNRTEGGHTLTLALEGGAGSNRDAVGAVATIEAAGHRQVIPRVGGGSYQSASDPRLHVGLGAAERADSVEVRWPSGRRDRYHTLAADAGYLLREGDPQPHPLPGYARPQDHPAPGAP